jgi:CheY-like chemotaxis protein
VSLGELSVMVVEDHAFQRRTIVRILANMGVTAVTEAEDGEAALALLGAGAWPDVILTDLDLPGVDGIALLGRIADSRPGQAIVVASGLDQDVLDAARVTGERHGLRVLGTMRKPVNAAGIRDTLARWAVPSMPVGTPAALSAAARGAEAVPADGQLRLLPQIRLDDGWLCGLALVRDAGDAEELIAAGCRLHHDLRRLTRDVRRVAPDVTITVGCPIPQIGGPDLAEALVARAALEGVAPRRLTLAIETASVVAAGDRGYELLGRLRLRGFGIALHAHRADAVHHGLPHTELALPPSIDEAASAVRAAHAAGITATAIACDDEAALAAARTAGFDRAQGAGVGVASDIDAITRWVAER